MSSKKFTFRGLMAPVFTPFDETRCVNYSVISDYADYLSKNGIKGVLVNGTTGEGVSLTTNERKNVLCEWMSASQKHQLTVMVQVGGTNMADVKELARHAERCKVSAILCLPDLFFRPSNVDDLLHYLKIVSSEAPSTPLLYYHIPGFIGIDLNMRELLERSSEVPTLVGIKFTDNDLVMGSYCVSNNLKQHAVFLGCDVLFFSALLQGFDSAIGTTINMFPTHNREILRYFNEKNFENAAKVQANLTHNIQQITKHGSWVSSMKAAMRKLTPVKVGPVRDPLVDINLKQKDLELIEILYN